MQKSIAESEDQIEKRIAKEITRQILAVHQRLDAFELRVLARPAPTIDLTTLQAAVASLRADVDAILDAWVPKTEATHAESADDMVFAALFQTTAAPPPPPREHAKRHRTREGDEACARKRERTEFEVARRSSLMDEEAQRMRDHELAAMASSSRIFDVERSTTEGVDIAEDTNDGVPTTEGVGSR
ncbi:uncharacterized protein LOC114076530 [Solanum pennellii]|uniref:Uncharacterized protein LOC114076530 n=1 Tax=Solanum pennellii TaxID=28526 RepID=A0ABM1V6V9_SOLPN|nr:uncharacterized protein LOC114076530 [Solanum pennellii]